MEIEHRVFVIIGFHKNRINISKRELAALKPKRTMRPKKIFKWVKKT